MNEDDAIRLSTNRASLVRDLDVHQILDHLVSGGILDDELEAHILVKTTRYDRVRELLRILPSRRPETYSVFRAALCETGQEHLVEALDNTDIDQGRRMRIVAGNTEGALINYIAKRDVTTTTVPSSSGASKECRLHFPSGVTYCYRTKTILVVDWGNHRIMRYDLDGNKGRHFMKYGDHGCGEYRPYDVATSLVSGRVFVTDDLNHRVVVFTNDGEYLHIIGSRGTGDGTFGNLRGIECHNSCVLVCDHGNRRVTMFSEDGVYLGHISTGRSFPQYVAVGPDDNIYVTYYDVIDYRRHGNVRVYRWDGTPLRHFGDIEGDCSTIPCGLTVDHQGYVCVGWCGHNCVYVYNRQGEQITTFGEKGHEPGQLWCPQGMVLLPDGRLVVCERENNRLQIF